MTKAISHKEFNHTVDTVTNYLSWETDTDKIEYIIRLFGQFNEAAKDLTKDVPWQNWQKLLIGQIEKNAS